jgi:hypothetical protein
MLSARITPPPPPNLPILPPEILRRIIRHALALPPSIPAPFPNIDAAEAAAEPDAQWNAFGARAARKGLDQRGAHRASVMRTALSFMAVCRAWKVSRGGSEARRVGERWRRA